MKIGADDPDLGQRILDLHNEEAVEAFFLTFPPAVRAERRRRWLGTKLAAVLLAGLTLTAAIASHPEAAFVIACSAFCGLCAGRVLFGRLP